MLSGYFKIRVTIWMCLFAFGVMSACSSPKPDSQHRAVLWGELSPVVSVKELMRDMIDPVADNIFQAVGTEITPKGVVEITPTTDADWEKIQIGAVTLAEGISLLKVRRPFTPVGDNNNSSGPDAPELSPIQITAKLEADPVLWNAKIEALRNVALEVMDLVKRKDANGLLAAGGDLDEACEGCHVEYWYPGEKALLQRLYREIDSSPGKGGR